MQSIVIAINTGKCNALKRQQEQSNARDVLKSLSAKHHPQLIFPVSFGFINDTHNCIDDSNMRSINILRRNSRIEIGNNRDLPYIKEILDLCSKIDCYKFGYINSDILVGKEFLGR